MTTISLSELNALDEAAFVDRLGAVFEHSPWVAALAAGRRPFPSLDDLHQVLLAGVRTQPRDRLVEFLGGHPELAGSLARQGGMTEDSTREQSSAGLDALSADQLAEMTRLNASYRAKNGFPFVLAVAGHTPESVLTTMRARSGNDTETELRAALDQIARITRMRLARLVVEDEPGRR